MKKRKYTKNAQKKPAAKKTAAKKPAAKKAAKASGFVIYQVSDELPVHLL